MAQNIGYLTAKQTDESNECYTPYYAVDPILKYIPKDKIIWCPFDEEWSAFYQSLKQNGYKVIRSHLKDGQDFFKYEPEEWDILLSNPPFSLKVEPDTVKVFTSSPAIKAPEVVIAPPQRPALLTK